MHGIIFTGLKKYVRTRLGDEAWNNLRTAAGLGGRVFLPVQAYPDEELQALLTTASSLTGISANELLEDYGRFIAPDFLNVYRALLNPDWRTLDLLEQLEHTIHPAVKANNPGARPPDLRVQRQTPDSLIVEYQSPRQLCALGKGLIKGIADHYGERITLAEPACMLRGHTSCSLIVTASQA